MGCTTADPIEKYHMDSDLEKYKVECKIGEGSFSEVLKCKDKTTGQMVAAKQLKKTFRSAHHASELPELIAMRKLTPHANILHMLESHFDPISGKVTLVFELMDMSLYDLMKNRKRAVPEPRSKNFLYQIVKGVDHIHHHGIFHRDIKPENILVKGELVKISDLGSIKGIYNRHPYTEYISTRWYRSPECLLTTGFYGPKMDVWAIGCVFYELLTLKPLFPGSSEIDMISKINSVLGAPSTRLMAKFKKHKSRNSVVSFPNAKGTGINVLLPFISEAGRDIIKQMLVYDPDQRTNVRRLCDHRYFNDFREMELFQKMPMATSSAVTIDGSIGNKVTWRNPALLSLLALERRRKKAPVKTRKRKLEKGAMKKESEISFKSVKSVKNITESGVEQSNFVARPRVSAPRAPIPTRNPPAGFNAKPTVASSNPVISTQSTSTSSVNTKLTANSTSVLNPAFVKLKARLNTKPPLGKRQPTCQGDLNKVLPRRVPSIQRTSQR